MHNFYVAFLGVFFSGQAASQLFQFSTSKQESTYTSMPQVDY